MTVACPFCQYELQDDQNRCPACNNPFNKDDWLDVPEAYSTDGLHPRLTLIHGGSEWRPNGNSFIIGRESHGGLDLNSPTVSREHVQVELVDNVWRVQKISKDFYLNDKLITQSAELHCGDELTIGGVLINVVIRYEQNAPSLKDLDELEIENWNITSLDDKSQITIGSSNSADIVVKSPHEFKVLACKRNEDWWIVDCNSPYAVKVNDDRIRNQKLNYGDRISIANIAFVYSKHGLKPVKSRLENEIVIQTINLGASTKKKTILEKINIFAKPKEFIGILGPSGSGKTSLIQRLIGLATITKGDCRVNGKSLKTKECKQTFWSNCAYLPQDVALHKTITVAEEMDCFCDLHNSECSHEDIPYALKKVGLEDKLEARVGSLSGGQQKRLGIAMELLRFPSALLLDEPTSGLDSATGTEVMDHLKTLAKQGKNVLCTTHQIEFFDYFDKVVILSQGRLVFFGKPDDAKTFFEQEFFKQNITPQEIYKRLADGSDKEQIKRAADLAEKFAGSSYAKKVKKEFEEINVPDLKERPGSSSATKKVFLQSIGYLKRSWYELFGFKNSEHPILDFFRSACCIQLLALPVLISLAIKLSCASKWWSCIEDAGDLFFFCLISAFWLGMNNSIRELVSERIPWRCLERLECVSRTSYLVSKLVWILLLCAVQTSIFSILTFCFVDWNFFVPTQWSGTSNSPVVCWSFEMFWILLGTSLIGAWIALAVSSIFKESTPAISMLPIILLPVLLFSEPVMHGNDYEKNLSIAVFCYDYSPCAAPLSLIKNVNEYNYFCIECKKYCDNGETHMEETFKNFKTKSSDAIHKVRPWVWKTIAIYFAIFISITIVFQIINEHKWEGR